MDRFEEVSRYVLKRRRYLMQRLSKQDIAIPNKTTLIKEIAKYITKVVLGELLTKAFITVFIFGVVSLAVAILAVGYIICTSL